MVLAGASYFESDWRDQTDVGAGTGGLTFPFCIETHAENSHRSTEA